MESIYLQYWGLISRFVAVKRCVAVYHGICLCSTREISSVCDHLVDTLGLYSAVGSLLKERVKELPCEHLLIWHSVLCWDVIVTKSLCHGDSVCNLFCPWLCYRHLLSQNSKMARKKHKEQGKTKKEGLNIRVVDDVILKIANVWYSLNIFPHEGSYVLSKAFSTFFFSTPSSLPVSLLRFPSLYLFSFELFKVCLQAQREQSIFLEFFSVIIGKFSSEYGPQFPVKCQWVCKGLLKIVCIVFEGCVGELGK